MDANVTLVYLLACHRAWLSAARRAKHEQRKHHVSKPKAPGQAVDGSATSPPRLPQALGSAHSASAMSKARSSAPSSLEALGGDGESSDHTPVTPLLAPSLPDAKATPQSVRKTRLGFPEPGSEVGAPGETVASSETDSLASDDDGDDRQLGKVSQAYCSEA